MSLSQRSVVISHGVYLCLIGISAPRLLHGVLSKSARIARIGYGSVGEALRVARRRL